MNKNKHSDLDDDLDHEGINRRQFLGRVVIPRIDVRERGSDE